MHAARAPLWPRKRLTDRRADLKGVIFPFCPHGDAGMAVHQLQNTIGKAQEIGALCIVVEDGGALLDGTDRPFFPRRLAVDSGNANSRRPAVPTWSTSWRSWCHGSALATRPIDVPP